MPTKERDQVFLNFNARFFLDHIRIAKKAPIRKMITHAITIPAMAPEFNDDDDVEKGLVFCSKGTSEDVEGGNVDESRDLDEVGDTEVGVDIREEREFLSLVVALVVDNDEDEMLDRLMGCKDDEGVDVGTSGRISRKVIVSKDPSLISSMAQATMRRE